MLGAFGGGEMNLFENDQTALHALRGLNILLFSVHVFLLIFFALMGINLMAIVNIGSVLFYIDGFLMLKREKIITYIFTTFIEITFHMFLAVICTGWDAGFQLYFFGCISIVFYADYFSVRLGQRHIKSGYCSAVTAVLYMVSLLVTRFWGSLYSLDETISLIWLIVNSLTVLVFVAIFFGMLTRRASFYEKELSKLATHDKLTGMVNRHYLVDQLSNIYMKQDISSYWIAILDIDDFKGINDKYGHLCGDFVLKSMAEMIKELCGDRTVCRWGGEEFLIVGSDSMTDKNKERPESAILENIRRTVAEKSFVYDEKTTVNMTVTIGSARYQEGQTVDEWISVADTRLYIGKQTGKNKVVEED